MPFDQDYFSTHTYEHISFKKYSQYWWSNRFYAALARRFAKPGDRLLEIGSGLGHLIGQLSEHFVTMGMDVNFWALKESRKTVRQSNLQVASADRLPFPDDSFGIVIIKHVVEHLEDPALCVAEIGRVLSKNGILIMSTPNLDSLMKPLKGEQWIGYQDPTHISLKLPIEWMQIVEKNGMQIIRFFSDGFWDVPYLKGIPIFIQKVFFGSLGGIQALTRSIFLPIRWGESIIVIAKRV